MALPAVVGAAVSAAGAAEEGVAATRTALTAGMTGLNWSMGLVRSAVAAVNQQLQEFNRGLAATGVQLGVVTVVSKAAADQMAGFVAKFSPGAITRFTLAADDLSASVGRVLLPSFEKATVAVRAVGDMVASLAPPAQNLAAGLAIAGAGFAAVSVAATAAGAAMAALSTGVGGIPLVIGAVAGGMLGLAYALKDTAEIQGIVNAAAREMTRLLNAAGAAAHALAPALGSLAAWLGRLGGAVSDTLVRVLADAHPVIARVGEAVAGMVRALALAAGPVGRMVQAVAAVAGDVIATRAEQFVGVVALVAEAAGNAGPALERLVRLLGALWDEVIEGIGTVGRALAGLTGDTDGLSAAVTLAADGVRLAVAFVRGSAFMLATALGAVRAALDAVAATAGVVAGAILPLAKLLGLLSGGPAESAGPGATARVLPPDSFRPGASQGMAVRGVSSSDQMSAIRRAQEAAFGSGQRPEVQTAKGVMDMGKTLGEIKTEIKNLPQSLAEKLALFLANNVPGVQTAGRAVNAASDVSAWAARQYVATVTGL